MLTENVLEMQGICKDFPGVRALHNVDFALRKGEIHALMGENGAGKSTLVKVMTGVYEKDAGRIVLEGKPIHMRSPQEAQNLGIGTVYQEVTLCPNLSVAENMYIGRGRYAFVQWKRMNAKAARLLNSLGIPARATQQLSSCSLAVQQMIAIARAIDMDCKILILD
ncbi:MAG: ATP-binding cassette domain-containing protein, partial [Spirochaetales bacterium]